MHFEYRGSFRYVDQRAIDLAIHEAHEHLEDDGISDLDREWIRRLWQRGTTIHVDVVMPPTADSYVAAGVLGALASRAIEGCVDVTRGGDIVDAFAPGG